jgi:RNA polymerase sigma-70 factor (ECF subfamily)
MTETEKLSDEELARTAHRGAASQQSRQAASALLARYQSRVYIWCFRFVREHEQALDLAQDVLLSAYRSLGSFSGHAKFYSWIFAIARNRCLNALRRPPLLGHEGTDIDDLAGAGPGPERELEEKLDEEALWDLVRSRLDSQEQEALYLRCFERMPVDAITVVLGIEETSGARAVLQRARRKLRSALQQQQGRSSRTEHA